MNHHDFKRQLVLASAAAPGPRAAGGRETSAAYAPLSWQRRHRTASGLERLWRPLASVFRLDQWASQSVTLLLVAVALLAALSALALRAPTVPSERAAQFQSAQVSPAPPPRPRIESLPGEPLVLRMAKGLPERP